MSATLLPGHRIIDVDSHITEPLDVWTARMSKAKWGDAVPHIERVDDEVVPADRSGVLVNFRVEPVQAASVVLHDANGEPLALGSGVELNGDAGAGALVGYDGAVYLEKLKPHNTLVVHAPAGDCRARFDYRYETGKVPLVGPLVCSKESP